MNKIILTLISAVTFLATSNAFAYDTAPGISSSTNNFLGPSLNWSHVMPLNSDAAAAYGLEVGPRNDRLSATVGYAFGDGDNQRIKLTGEYLWQDIDYTFYSGVTRQWVSQGAVGLDYQYLINKGIISDVDVGGYYSHAPSQNLSPVTSSYTINNSTYQYTNLRRIAGSNAQGSNVGTDLNLWPGANVNVKVDYDRVIYDTIYQPSRNAIGLGAETTLSQNIVDNFKTDLTASVRQPFNYYKADLVWAKNYSNSELNVGVYGSYTHGKNALPNTAQAGLMLSYKENDSKAAKSASTSGNDATNRLEAWTLQPAVRMPQVLAVADQRVIQPSSSTCGVTFIGPDIPNQNLPTDVAIAPINGADYFRNTGNSTVTYSLVGTIPTGLSINEQTGIVSGTPDEGVWSLEIRATNECGSAISNQFTLTIGTS